MDNFQQKKYWSKKHFHKNWLGAEFLYGFVGEGKFRPAKRGLSARIIAVARRAVLVPNFEHS